MALSRIAETLDVRALLPRVHIPTLVVQSADDSMFGAEHGRYLAEHIPDARLVEVPGRDHLFLWESGEVVSDVIETFIFSTRLTRITELLRGRSYRQVLRRLTDVRDWSGGTRIGESFAQFNREWPHLVDRRTIVIVLSDGWDTGEPDVLATELMRIKRRAARLIWLNPLLGNPSYEPLTRGMAAAMPLIDDFAAGHNLAALRDLAGKLHL